jgi:hypothetical protein
MCGIGEFRVSSQHSMQVDFLGDHVVAAIQLSRCARHSERQVRKFCNTVTELDMSLQIRQHRLQIGSILLLALFTPRPGAELVDLLWVRGLKFPSSIPKSPVKVTFFRNGALPAGIGAVARKLTTPSMGARGELMNKRRRS